MMTVKVADMIYEFAQGTEGRKEGCFISVLVASLVRNCVYAYSRKLKDWARELQ